MDAAMVPHGQTNTRSWPLHRKTLPEVTQRSQIDFSNKAILRQMCTWYLLEFFVLTAVRGVRGVLKEWAKCSTQLSRHLPDCLYRVKANESSLWIDLENEYTCKVCPWLGRTQPATPRCFPTMQRCPEVTWQT